MTSGIRTKADIDLDQCMLYAGSIKISGYPKSPNTIIRRYGNQVSDLHRFVYLTEIGELVAGMVIDHICGNKSCINSDHLQQITSRENTIILSQISPASINARKITCQNGHNRWYLDPRGSRRCRECHRLKMAAKAKERMLICA